MVLFDTTFRAIKKIKINRKRLTFYLVEPRPKSSYGKSVVKGLSDPPPPGKAGEPGLFIYKSAMIEIPSSTPFGFSGVPRIESQKLAWEKGSTAEVGFTRLKLSKVNYKVNLLTQVEKK